MKTYGSYVNFLCSLMAIDIPDICYCFKEQYYDVNGFGVEPFEMEPHCKTYLIPDENRIYINLNEMHRDLRKRRGGKIPYWSGHEKNSRNEYECKQYSKGRA